MAGGNFGGKKAAPFKKGGVKRSSPISQTNLPPRPVTPGPQNFGARMAAARAAKGKVKGK